MVVFAVIGPEKVVNTSFHFVIPQCICCDIVLTEQNELMHNQKQAMGALLQEYEAMVLTILRESKGLN